MKVLLFIFIIILAFIGALYPLFLVVIGFISFIVFIVIYSNKEDKVEIKEHHLNIVPYQKPTKETILNEENYETEYKYPSDFVSTDYWPEDKPFPFKRTARRRAQRLIALPRRRASRK